MLHESQATEACRQVHCLLHIPQGKSFFLGFSFEAVGGPGFLSMFPERIRSRFKKFNELVGLAGNLQPKTLFFAFRVVPLDDRSPKRENLANNSVVLSGSRSLF